jgi:nicotinate-nucleotide adenylyltransferase
LTAKRIGLYGGTFDPIHNGHLRVIVELLSRKIVDQIILIPSGQPLLREAGPTVDGATRLEMCKLAIEDLPKDIKDSVYTSDIEIKRDGPSFAFDTVEEIENSVSGEKELYWIIGSDAYANIEKWHRHEELQEKVNFIVIDRPGDDGDGIDIGALDISATQIRNDKQLNGISPSVRKFITERKLYASK